MTTAPDGSLPVAEIMATEIYTLTPEVVVASALRLSIENGSRYLFVLEKGTLTGIVSRRDLRTADQDALVGECMRSPVLCIETDQTVDEALDSMEQNEVGCLGIINGDCLVGIVTRALLRGERETPPETPDEESSSAN